MTTMKTATARQPPMGPINPPNESAFSDTSSGLLAISSTALWASAGTTGRTSTICSSPMLMVALGATMEVARTLAGAKDPDLTAEREEGCSEKRVTEQGGEGFRGRLVSKKQRRNKELFAVVCMSINRRRVEHFGETPMGGKKGRPKLATAGFRRL